jgi:tRNA pseudouridine13 synthase
MKSDMKQQFAYLHKKPSATGQLRASMADFKVFEQLPFSPSGEGEHLFIHIRKIGANTVFVARQLARYFEVKESLVSYAGLKDRFAITEQWFAVHVPGKQVYDLSDVEIEGVEILSYCRHHKKLRTGALSGNRFELTLTKVSDVDQVQQRWQQIVDKGVPNYFGEQRFGINGGNLDRASELFAGTKVKDKKKRGIYLSAARSHLFNAIVSQRIEQGHFEHLIGGDVCMLAGTQSVFVADDIDPALTARLEQKDIDITAPLWGAGELMTGQDVAIFEQSIADQHPEFCAGLAKFGLKQERRRIRLILTEPSISIEQDTVQLGFVLAQGSYATTILKELLDYQDMTERAVVGNVQTAE